MGDKPESGESGLRPALELVPDGLKPPSAQKRRLFELPRPEADDAILYQHSVLCQTCLPFRDPGDDVRKWERANGLVNGVPLISVPKVPVLSLGNSSG